MHDVAVRPIVIVVGAVEVNASVELDTGGISRITLRDYWIITAGQEHDEHCEQGENRGRYESNFVTHREIMIRVVKRPESMPEVYQEHCVPVACLDTIFAVMLLVYEQIHLCQTG